MYVENKILVLGNVDAFDTETVAVIVKFKNIPVCSWFSFVD